MKNDIKMMPLSELKGAPYNPRRISPEALAGLTASIKRFGLTQPIVWNKRTKRIVSGHQRVKALKAMGEKEALVMIVDWPEIQEKAANLAHNNPAIEGEFTGSVDELLAEIMAGDKQLFDDLLLEDISGADIEPLAGGLTDADVAPPKPVSTKIKVGDLYALGDHRIFCGDSTKPSDVKRLMTSNKAVLMNTDPPYGVDYGDVANSRDRAANKRKGGNGKIKRDSFIKNDELDGKQLQAFLESAIRSALPHLIENPAFYLWHPMLTQGTFFAAAAADILIHRQIIWVKPSLIMGRGDYHWRHELCFYGWIRGKRCRWYAGRNQDTVWDISRENDGIHPTQKPVELFIRPIQNHTKKGDIIYEPFSGSGSQIIAAEQTARRCFAIEIDPGYVEVAIKRWEDFTGKKSKKIS
jgi:DNA modification methylase